MLEIIFLGALQGIVDWLPVSSEGVLVLAQALFFEEESLTQAIRVALFLHLGSLLAVVVYFWRDVRELLVALFSYSSASEDTRALLWFLIISSFITGGIGLSIYLFLEEIEEAITITAAIIVLVIGLLLIVTSLLQFRVKDGGLRSYGDARLADSLLTGFVQSLSVLPGLSRSGSTVAVLLLRKFKSADALKMSFFMSLPVVFGGNIVLNMEKLLFEWEMLAGVAAAFVFGFATIHVLLGIAERINFAWFTLVFGVITLITVPFIW